jgi:hypothetical protein
MPRSVRHLLVAMAAVATLAGQEAAAQDMTTSDLTRLQQTSDQISTELQQLRQRDRTGARALQAELADLDDEIIYLKVKLRKDGNVGRYEFTDLRDRLENLRSRVRGDATGSYSTATGTDRGDRYPIEDPRADKVATPGTLPTGTELDVRLSSRLTSDTARVEDRFEATTLVDVRQNGRVVVPAGSVVRGVVTEVKKAGRVERKGSLTLTFDQIRINGRAYPIRGTMTEALEAGGYKEDAEKIGAGAAVGAVIGGLLGGVKGAITGILIGGGGVVAATEGENVDLAEGTVLRMRLDAPLAVRSNLTQR